MEPVLVGYFLRRTSVPQGDWPLPPHVEEVCSVSDCMNPSPDDWIERWLHNELGLFNTRHDAETMIVDRPDLYHLFAFRILPVRYEKGRRAPLIIPKISVEPLPDDFISLGFDVVSKSDTPFFEHSPLSCNALAEDVAVNRYCLVDTLAEAEALADRCAREEPEPGPYYVVEVLRKRS